MGGNVKLGWSPLAVGQFLELQITDRDRVDKCVELLTRFPRMGYRIRLAGEHMRRFLCGDRWIIYRLEIADAGEPIERKLITAFQIEEHQQPAEITIKYIRHNGGSVLGMNN
ncbi:MAG: hypothetical protein WC911_05920 [Thermoleophilia bacterium]